MKTWNLALATAMAASVLAADDTEAGLGSYATDYANAYDLPFTTLSLWTAYQSAAIELGNDQSIQDYIETIKVPDFKNNRDFSKWYSSYTHHLGPKWGTVVQLASQLATNSDFVSFMGTVAGGYGDYGDYGGYGDLATETGVASEDERGTETADATETGSAEAGASEAASETGTAKGGKSSKTDSKSGSTAGGDAKSDAKGESSSKGGDPKSDSKSGSAPHYGAPVGVVVGALALVLL